MPPSENADLILDELRQQLARKFGKPQREHKARIVTFGSSLTCSLNYSKLLRGNKYFFGIPPAMLDAKAIFPPTTFGEFVVLICGALDRLLVLPRRVVIEMLAQVPSRRVDIFFDDGQYTLQTTRHPKMDVTPYLNAFPQPESLPEAGETATEHSPTTQDRIHVRIQSGLITLGKTEGCSVWVPPADRNLSYNGEPLSAHTLPRLPNFGFDETSRRIIQNIDVLWLAKNLIRKAFEIEATTSIYSGLLRLNDLALAQPNNQVALYLVASNARREKVHSQLLRPSFHPLLERCQFLTFESIEEKLKYLAGLPPGAHVTGLLRGEKFEMPEHLAYPEDLENT